MFGLLGRVIPLFTPPLTADQVQMLKRDNVAGQSGEAGVGAARDLGIGPLETIEVIAPTYLWRFRPYGQFTTPTQAAG
jgi:NADH dehydrogenase